MAAFVVIQQRGGVVSGLALSSVDHRSARGERDDQSAAPARIVLSLSMRVAHSRFHDRPAGTSHSAKDAGRGVYLLCLSARRQCLDGLSLSETTLPAPICRHAETHVQMSTDGRGNRHNARHMTSSHNGLAFAKGKRSSPAVTVYQEFSYG